jgi:hypothetical protein
LARVRRLVHRAQGESPALLRWPALRLASPPWSHPGHDHRM